jgi:RNA polymerase sigma-70 factor (ECF subfamily)
MAAMSQSDSQSAFTRSEGETSLSLLARASANDAAGWRQLVQIYSPLVFYWARRSGLRESDSADIVQEVWQSVAAALPRFHRDQQGGTFRGWLWTITRNKLNDHFRARNGKAEAAGGTEARQHLENVAESEPLDESGAEDQGLLHRTLELIRKEFEERTWLAFWRMTVENRSAAEVGQELGLTANAVHQAKFRVLRRLRAEMEGLVEV